MVVVLLLVVLCCGPGLDSKMIRPIWYHSDPMNWENARSICQRNYGGDLLTVLSQADLDSTDLSAFQAWVGLQRHGNGFRWDDANEARAPQSWHSSPVHECGVTTYQHASPQADNCENGHFFFCKGDSSDVLVPLTYSYYRAKDDCETHYSGISTFPEQTSLEFEGSPLYTPQEFPVWIGLHSSENSWSWSDEQTSDFRNWVSDPGSTPGPNSCAAVGSQSKSMWIYSCLDSYPFLCYNPNPMLLQELLTWEQALQHCKNLSSSSSFSLLSVNQSSMGSIKKVLSFAQTTKVWVGLRFLAGSWFWSDGSSLPVPFLPSCPAFTLGCGALVLSAVSDPVIAPTDCSEKLNVLCSKEPDDD